jgi:glucan phosphoethanolaminetransferase (alkaline phosphatase superfamily)
MDIERISKFAFLASATYILLCIPAIFLAEHFALKQSPIHGTQSLAVTLCLPASLVFLWCSRSRAFKPIHWLCGRSRGSFGALAIVHWLFHIWAARLRP